MKTFMRHVAVTASSVAVAGAAVFGAGSTALAATSASAHVQRPALSANADGYRGDRGIGYLLELGYSWDEIRGWHRDGHDEITADRRRGRSESRWSL
ncbi:hypothetical protein ACFV0T_22305 [Streptomyces sp. NPDC059582]|uniref:hypothetical protein n=1 Tax=Streptomyces sp. NPDC059582 TaxID=3346875 RepID=UPI0036CD7CAD